MHNPLSSRYSWIVSILIALSKASLFEGESVPCSLLP